MAQSLFGVSNDTWGVFILAGIITAFVIAATYRGTERLKTEYTEAGIRTTLGYRHVVSKPVHDEVSGIMVVTWDATEDDDGSNAHKAFFPASNDFVPAMRPRPGGKPDELDAFIVSLSNDDVPGETFFVADRKKLNDLAEIR